MPVLVARAPDYALIHLKRKLVLNPNRRWPLGPSHLWARFPGTYARCHLGVGARTRVTEGFVNGASLRGG